MIPKIIHYCWLSNDPIPEELQFYIQTWKKYFSDYEFVKWDFTRFNKSDRIWVSQAFDNKKYAFAADYIRLYAIYHYGGIYLDSDVEVLNSFNDYLNLKTMIGWQYNHRGLEVAVFGAEKGQEWVGKCLDYYKDRPFIKADGQFDMFTLPLLVENVLKDNGYKFITVDNIDSAYHVSNAKCIPVFEPDFFSPKSFDGRLHISGNTVSIHHFVASWTSPMHRFLRKLAIKIGGYRLKNFLSFVKKKICN